MSEKKDLLNFVNGELVPARSGQATDVINPSTGEVYATAPLSGPEDVDAALQAANKAFDEAWRDTTPSERMGYLLRMADAIEQNAERLVEVEAENTGKPKALTMSEELPPMVDQIRFFAGAARVLEGRATGEYMKGYTSSVRREPVGVIGSVAPWNYPMMMAVWKFAPALAAGNTIVLKPSDTTPASSVHMAELFADILPPGVFNVVCGDRDTGAALVGHPIPAMVSITGSTRAGRAVAHAAADTVKRTHLELGGKAGDRLRRRRHRERRRGHRRRRVLQRRPGLHRGHPGAGERPDPRRLRQRARRAGAADQAVQGRAARRRLLHPAGEQPQPVGARQRVPGAGTRSCQGPHRRAARRRPGLLLRPHRGGRPAPGRRDDPARDLRPGHHHAGVLRRRGGAAMGQRRRLRPCGERVDPRPQAGDAHGPPAGLRLRLDQLPHPAGRRDAARRLQAVRVRKDLSLYSLEEYTRIKHVMSYIEG